MAGEDGFMILRGAKAADGVSGGGLLDPAAMMRKDLLLVNSGGESVTDHEDWRLKEESKSPKPKKKFGSNFGSTLKKSAIGSIRRPNMSNFKQKIKNKLRKDLPIFGSPLEVAIQRSLLGTDGIELPTVFRECISFLEENWLEHEGLYRLPGVKSKVEDAKARYDRGEAMDLEDYDPNVVASLLKQYLRELPEPLVHPRITAVLETAASLPSNEQVSTVQEYLEEVPTPNKLMLAWILQHMMHITQHSSVNKMSLPNLVIVFSPTLQLSAPILHTLYNNAQQLFGDVELAKYEKPVPVVTEKKVLRRPKAPTSLRDFDDLTTEEEVSAELEKLTTMLDKLHSKMAGKFDEQRNEVIWEVQRAITELRRKKKSFQKKVPEVPESMAGGEEEFMKTLLLMEATLAAENEELLSKKEKLQEAIRDEIELIDQYKAQLREQQSRLADSCEESGDEGELARKVATLRWTGKELEMRNKNLVEGIKEEEDEIFQLRIKLKVLPLKQKLNAADE